MTYYFPGCKYTAHSPAQSKALQEYLARRHGVETVGCCSLDHKVPQPGDRALFVCPTCAAILEESALPGVEVTSIYEYLLEDPSFPWPDYGGERLTIQDCWRTFDHRAMQEAIRAILSRMNIDAVELPNSFERADFCGATRFQVPSPRYEKLCPRRLVEHGDFRPLPPEEQRRLMEENGKNYTTHRVICYCTGCMTGVEMGGHTPLHLMDLIMEGLC